MHHILTIEKVFSDEAEKKLKKNFYASFGERLDILSVLGANHFYTTYMQINNEASSVATKKMKDFLLFFMEDKCYLYEESKYTDDNEDEIYDTGAYNTLISLSLLYLKTEDKEEVIKGWFE